MDAALPGGGVLVLDDRQDVPTAAPYDPAVAARVGNVGGQHGGRVALPLVGAHQLPQGGTGQQRMVAVGDDHGARQAAELFQDHADGVTGAVLLILYDGYGLRRGLLEVLDDLLPQVTDHHDEPPGFELRGGGQHMADHAPPAQLVEDLGGTGLHPCALTCGEDDHGSRAAGTHFGGSWHRGLGMVQA